MSAPIVAGITALVRARYTAPCLTPHDILGHVKETSIDIRWENLPPWGEVRLNRVDALTSVSTAPVCDVPRLTRFDRSR